MDEPDTAAIVDPDPDSATDRETSLVDSFGHRDETRLKPPFSCSQPVSVEPVLFLSMFSLTLLAPLSTQYLWDRISEDLGYNGSERSECNSSLPPDPLQKVGHCKRVKVTTVLYCAVVKRWIFGASLNLGTIAKLPEQ